MPSRRSLSTVVLVFSMACGSNSESARSDEHADSGGPQVGSDAAHDSALDAGPSGATDASLPDVEASETGTQDAGLRNRPDGGYPAPCDPQTGFWVVHPAITFNDFHTTQVTANVVDFATRTVIGSAPLTNPPGSSTDWIGSVDPAQLAGSPSCEELTHHFIVLVGRDNTGRIVSAGVEDAFLRDLNAFANIQGGGVIGCSLSLALRAVHITPETQVDLFAWNTRTTTLSGPVPLTRAATDANADFADYSIQSDSLLLCNADPPSIYIVVDHEQDVVRGVYADAD